MQQLVEKYKPTTLDGFSGLERARTILGQLAAQPYSSAWLLFGPSGVGKTTMALALAEQVGGEVHHIPSRTCDLATVGAVVERCHYYPWSGSWHFVLVDEADQMSRAAQLAFLSKLDTTAAPPNTIFLFTANATTLLEDRFLSRCRTIQFEAPTPVEIEQLLRRIWLAEGGGQEPDFAAIVTDSKFNVRECLMRLELELIAPQPLKSSVAPIPARLARTPESAGGALDAVAVARLLNIHQATVYNWVKRGKLPPPTRSGNAMTWTHSQLSSLQT